MSRRAWLPVAVASAAVIVPAAVAVATAPPEDSPDTNFLRGQGEDAARNYFVSVDPSVTSVACAAPAEDLAGVQFLCYGINADGTVQTAWATLNDDGGIDISPAGGATAPTSAPTTTAGPVVGSYEGTGDQLLQVDPISTPTIVSITHDGAAAFAVQPQQGGVPAGSAVVETEGASSGRYLVGVGNTVAAFAITADGNWTLTLEQRSSALTFDPAAGVSGETPDVIAYDDSAQWSATASYEGSGTIVIRAVTVSGSEELMNEQGPFSGDVIVPPGPGFVAVEAIGVWSLAPSVETSTT